MKHDRRAGKSGNQNQKKSMAIETRSEITRRRFLGTTAAGSAAVLAGGLTSFFKSSVSAARSAAVWIEKTIPELQSLMASGQLSSRDLTHGYLQRIADLNPLI